MAATISVTVEDLAKKLKDIFASANIKSQKYSEVWLSDADSGGLYYNDKVIVNIKVGIKIESRNEEIKHVGIVLFKQLSLEERSLIWRVVVYNSFEEIHSESDDLLVYKA